MTFGITLALTLYAFTTKSDFTIFGATFFILAMSLFLFCLFAIISGSHVLYVLCCVLSAILYGYYLVYDTQLIMGGKYAELSLDDYIIGSLIIYIDIIILFLRLLRILSYLMKSRWKNIFYNIVF